MAKGGFWRDPRNLPADKNPQVNEPGLVKKMITWWSVIGSFESIARFYFWPGIIELFLYNI